MAIQTPGLVESARSRAFRHFDQGLRPSQLPDLGVEERTLYRYFQDWKRLRCGDTWLQRAIPSTRPRLRRRRVRVVPSWLVDRLLRAGVEAEGASYLGQAYRSIPALRRRVDQAYKAELEAGVELWRQATWPSSLRAGQIAGWFKLAEEAQALGLLSQVAQKAYEYLRAQRSRAAPPAGSKTRGGGR